MSEQVGVPDHPVVVDTPGWRSIRPRIPDTPQRRQLAAQRSVREIVFGAQDGILTTMGVVTGIGVATNDRLAVAISGVLVLLSGALSMGVGEFQGSESEREVVQSSIELEKSEMAANPADEFTEQVAYYKTKGFSAEEAHMIVSRLVQNPEIYLYEMMRDEFGIDPRLAEESSIRPAVAIALAFSAGSALPILPYLFPIDHMCALVASVVLALLGLFGIGFFAGKLAGRSPVARGVQIALYGSAVFIISFLAGHFIPPLFGHTPVSLGG